MRVDSEIHKRMRAAYVLLQGKEISISIFEQVVILIKGLEPRVDKKLSLCSEALDTLQKIQKGDVIMLSADTLPEETDEQKKRKKTILFFITSLRDLRSEIKRVEKAFAKVSGQKNRWEQIVFYLKKPFGIITMVIVVIVSFLIIQILRHS